MNLDFLPNLPKSNLDDRTQLDLVEEALLRIPRYCPEWTNYNSSDPGVTLIELFGWITEQMLHRFNQVPRRNYVTFLELLGMRLNPPVPAQTDLTFYLNTTLDEPYVIPAGIEVATVRTELEEAVVFSTDRAMTISVPQVRHLLTADTREETPQVLQDRLTNFWTQAHGGEWFGPEQALFASRPHVGNCVYIVLEPTSDIAGNVIALTVTGAAAATTGIDPSHPPRRWEAWDGEQWQPVLRDEQADQSQGFSFHRVSQQSSANPRADITLHLPKSLPIATFAIYEGHWLRCVCTAPSIEQPAYTQSPRIRSLNVRAVGGTVEASQCQVIREESLGISDGSPGQTFQLFGVPVLPRRSQEYLQVMPPDGLPEAWEEVANFANSTPEDRHYVIDSVTGVLQLGPLVREPSTLKQAVTVRGQIQSQAGTAPSLNGHPQDQQYGKIPQRGAALRMVAYRTGGGQQGNVQANRLQVMKVALPYVASVTNHVAAASGADAESLEQAAIRVPHLLRNRDRAVTAEDFEFLTLQAGRGAVAQCRCLSIGAGTSDRGTVRLLVVPQVNTEGIARCEGVHPDRLQLRPHLQNVILDYLSDRKLLGTQIELSMPHYVGVSVRAEVGLSKLYNTPQAREAILRQLRVALYRFLNPLTGGVDGTGWPFGGIVYASDVMGILQQVAGVDYVGVLQLFELHLKNGVWVRHAVSERSVDPGPTGLICSWNDRALRANHTVNAIHTIGSLG